MHTNTNPQRDTRQVLQLKRPHKRQDVQGHVGDVNCMSVTISFGQAWRNHICISYCLNLKDIGLKSVYIFN